MPSEARLPKTTAKVRRPTLRSCATSRWLFTASAEAASAPSATAASQVIAPTLPVCTKSDPATAAQTEEDEDDQFTERCVGDRPRAAHIGERGDQRAEADGEDRHTVRGDQRKSQRNGHPAADDDGRTDLSDSEPAVSRRPRQSGAIAGALGAAHGVADIVLQVGDHLQQHCAAERQQHRRRVESPGAIPGERGADENRTDRDQQTGQPTGNAPGSQRTRGDGRRSRRRRWSCSVRRYQHRCIIPNDSVGVEPKKWLEP